MAGSNSQQNFDVVVIGSGPGGYVAAVRAAQLGFKTACVEKMQTFGGTCLNVGCIPSKALLQSSEHYAFIHDKAKEHGILCKEPRFDWDAMQQRKDQVVEGLVKSVGTLFQKYKIASFPGHARFVSPQTLQVGNDKITSQYYILATGSEPAPLPMLPFDEKKVLSSTGALSLQKIPKKLLVVGAGVIGVELASVYGRLGSEITIIEMLDRICPAMDKAVSRALLQALKKQGLVFHLGAKVASAKISNKEVFLSVEEGGEAKEFSADAVLVAVGRRPYSEGLGLEEIGVEKTKQGFVKVNESFATSQLHIFAIGDLIEGVMLAHRASEEGIAVAEMLAGQRPHIRYAAIPNVIYTHPEVAALGFTEEEAKERGIQVMIGTCSFRGNPRARCSGDMDGMVKVIGESNSHALIGMHIIGPHASEMIGEGVLAMEKRATLDELAAASHAHPTLTEAIKEATMQALGKAIHI